MNKSELQTLVNKVMADASFAKALEEKPTEALDSVGIQPTPELLDALKGVDAQSIQQLASTFNDDQAAC